MKFCTECGKKADDQTQVCTECGTKLPSTTTNINQSSGKSGLPVFSKKTKIVFASLLVVFISLFTAFKLISSYNSPEKVLERFLEAVQKEDVKYLASTLESANDKLEMNEANVKALLTYWDENDQAKKDFFSFLQESSKEMTRSTTKTTAAFNELLNEEGWQPIHFKKDGKKFLFFDKYAFIVQPIELEVYTNYPDVTFSINGKKQQAKEEEGRYILGPVLPGVHTIKGTLKTDFLTLDKEIEAHVFNQNHYEDLYFEASTVVVESNIKEGSILINGEETDLVLDDGYLSFGPVLVDGSMTLQVVKETSMGLLKSPEYKIEETHIFGKVNISEKQQEEVMTFINDALLSYRKALAGKDEELLSSFSGNQLDRFKDKINSMDEDMQWIGYLLNTTYDTNSFYTFEEDGELRVSVLANANWLENNYYYDELSETNSFEEYYLKPEKDGWSIYYTDSVWGSIADAEETKDFEFDQAEQEKDTPKPKVVLKEEDLISDYLYGLVDSVNYGDFTYVEEFLLPESELFVAQKDLVTRLYDAGTKESVVDFEVLETEKLDDDSGTVLLTVSETIEIQKDGEDSVIKTFEWKYTAQIHNGKYHLSKIEEV